MAANCSNVGGWRLAGTWAVAGIASTNRGEGRARSAGAAPWLRGRGIAWENRAYSACYQNDPPALIVTGETQAAQLVPIGDWDGDGKTDFVDLVLGLIYRGSQVPAVP